MNSQQHNQHIGYTVFGYPNWKSMKNAPIYTKLPYYVITDAIALAIDFTNSKNKNKLIREDNSTLYEKISPKKYEELKKNIKAINSKGSLSYKDLSSFFQIKGKHRTFNHQGFFYSYQPKSNESKRWEAGRDDILIPSIKIAFNTTEDIATLIAIIAYYTHLFGDLLKGETVSLGSIGNTLGMIDAFKTDLNTQVNKITNNKLFYLYQNFITEINNLNTVLKDIKIIAPLYYDYKLWPVMMMDIMGHHCPQIIKYLLGNTKITFNQVNCNYHWYAGIL